MELKASPFQKGLYMKVPKGTELIRRWNSKDDKTGKEVVVEISSTALPNADDKLTQAEKDERERRLNDLRSQFEAIDQSFRHKVHYPARTVPNGRGGSYTYEAYDRMELIPEREADWEKAWKADSVAHEQVRQEYTKLGESRYTPDDVIVFWSKNDKATFAKNVQLVEKPEARKKQPKVNIRQQMVTGSRWKVTQDLDIMYGAANPAYHAAINAYDKANPHPGHGANVPQGAHSEWYKAREAFRAQTNKDLGEYIPKLYVNLPAGTILEVTGKFLSYFQPNGWQGERYGNVAPVLREGIDTRPIGLEYSMIKDFIEAESIPTVDVWVLRHKPTGKYYVGPNYDEGNYRFSSNSDRDFSVDAQDMADTFMKGKKWDNLGKAKTSVLMITGYYENLPGADESLPEWGGGGKTFEVTDDWEMVKFDKLGRKEIGPVEDFQEWFKRSWELRELTVQFGSSVRTVYKALEKAKLLDSQKGMVVFTETNEDKLDDVGYHGDTTAINDGEKKLIEDAIASLGLKRGTFKKAVDYRSMAVSFANKNAALMFKLAYQGTLKVTVLDLETLKEAVDG
jgi:hypothetical protein